MSLPSGFFKRPFAHRGLHGSARPENSREAIAAAVAQGFGIELDVQMSRDGRAMVFHDYGLARLTGESGTVQTTDAERLAALPLTGGQTGAPPLEDILAAVAGRVPLLIEIKDQDGALGPDIGRLEDAVATALSGYAGPLAVMSFNPHSVAAMASLAPQVPRGIVTCAFAAEAW
ncbi:MAG: glycerophosphodiester phosphodiesterase family protein, partial [Pseudomonadota bacterium]